MQHGGEDLAIVLQHAYAAFALADHLRRAPCGRAGARPRSRRCSTRITRRSSSGNARSASFSRASYPRSAACSSVVAKTIRSTPGKERRGLAHGARLGARGDERAAEIDASSRAAAARIATVSA